MQQSRTIFTIKLELCSCEDGHLSDINPKLTLFLALVLEQPYPGSLADILLFFRQILC